MTSKWTWKFGAVALILLCATCSRDEGASAGREGGGASGQSDGDPGAEDAGNGGAGRDPGTSGSGFGGGSAGDSDGGGGDAAGTDSGGTTGDAGTGGARDASGAGSAGAADDPLAEVCPSLCDKGCGGGDAADSCTVACKAEGKSLCAQQATAAFVCFDQFDAEALSCIPGTVAVTKFWCGPEIVAVQECAYPVSPAAKEPYEVACQAACTRKSEVGCDAGSAGSGGSGSALDRRAEWIESCVARCAFDGALFSVPQCADEVNGLRSCEAQAEDWSCVDGMPSTPACALPRERVVACTRGAFP